MPKEQEEFQSAVKEILKVVIFENWLRFYFIVEEKGEGADENSEPVLKIQLPEKSLQKISEYYPDLLPLAEKLNGKPIDFETSRNAVLSFVLDHLDGQKLPKNMAQTVFSSAAFQTRTQLFNIWVQIHEEQLDQGFLDFKTWLDLFFKWEAGPGARLVNEFAHAPQNPHNHEQ